MTLARVLIVVIALFFLWLVLDLTSRSELVEPTRVVTEQKFPTSWPSTTSTSQPSHVQVITSVPRARTHPMRPFDWDALAQCESGGRWSLDAVYDGGLQFAPSTWTAYRLPSMPTYAYQATREQQIVVAERVRYGVPGSHDPYLNAQGLHAWPSCSRKLGVA